MTPEEIEGLDPNDLPTIKQTASELHDGVLGVLDRLSLQDAEQQEQLREATKLKLLAIDPVSM